MATQLQLRRGTTAENDVFTGAPGELTMDTDTNGIRIHDGNTVGGINIPTAQTADYVVEWQMPTDLNNYTWYRKYKSGWIEQGGHIQATATNNFNTITLPQPMGNANYNAIVTNISPYVDGAGSSHAYVMAKAAVTYNKNTTSFGIFSQDGGNGSKYDWYVIGMAA